MASVPSDEEVSGRPFEHVQQQEQQQEYPQKKPSSSTTTTTTITDASDAYYTFDPAALESLRSRAPWREDPRWFRKVAVSPSAVTKMMVHCHSGVTKGVAKGGRPVEVMGLLLGRPDPASPRTLVLSDAFPLSVEGFETSVVADNDEVFAEMIRTSESVDRTRRERVVGWYHSHPFDVGPRSHCFLSGTDHQTQTHWQRVEDPNGNPWTAVVVDPLRGLVRREPELKAFRAYPPDYASPRRNECPDGAVVDDERTRLEMWGACWDRYYELEVEYFASSAARRVMATLTKSYLWTTTLGSSPTLAPEARARATARIEDAARALRRATSTDGGVAGRSVVASEATGASSESDVGAGTEGGGGAAGDAGKETTAADQEQRRREEEREYQGLVDLAAEKLHGNITQITKQHLFC